MLFNPTLLLLEQLFLLLMLWFQTTNTLVSESSTVQFVC